MKKDDKIYRACLAVLREELIPAYGCTEPVALALAAAAAREALGEPVVRVTAQLSGNIIKNAKSVTVPNTGGLKGIEAAVAAGIIAGDASAQLRVLAEVPPERIVEIQRFQEQVPVQVELMETEHILDIRLRLYGESHSSCVHIQDGHTNIVSVEKDGCKVWDLPETAVSGEEKPDTSRSLEPKGKPDLEAGLEPGPYLAPEAGLEPEENPETEAGLKSEENPETEAGLEPEENPETEAGLEPEENPETEAGLEPEESLKPKTSREPEPLWAEKLAVEDADRALLTVKDILDFVQTVELEEVRELLERQMSYNMAIAREGLRGGYGANIGRLLLNTGKEDVKIRARALAAAGSDARMSGCSLPVVIVSGSGNQGITASVPVMVYAKELGVSHEKELRAVLLSDLLTIHLKTGIGKLSAYCGAVSAGCGSGAAIAYLCGGGYEEISHTLVNALAIVSGMICDGAKASCAAKIALAVEAGIMGFHMYQEGQEFKAGDGIVTKGIEANIQNIGQLAKVGMRETDREILNLMVNC